MSTVVFRNSSVLGLLMNVQCLITDVSDYSQVYTFTHNAVLNSKLFTAFASLCKLWWLFSLQLSSQLLGMGFKPSHQISTRSSPKESLHMVKLPSGCQCSIHLLRNQLEDQVWFSLLAIGRGLVQCNLICQIPDLIPIEGPLSHSRKLRFTEACLAAVIILPGNAMTAR